MREVTDQDAGQSVRLSRGELLVITLRENPTTGYRWKVEANGEPFCRLTRDNFEPGLALGAEGTHAWRFRAARLGATRIRLTLQRPWKPAARPARSFVLRVRVSPTPTLP
ncbi:MAG: protease inhibitor I42 family protein [Acidobacteriia bacterium]|nr:protease inhibitor I42 family protein [Terriglobia bacterium]